jgi:alpha-tubulin suppressor-like RCC1 family protein
VTVRCAILLACGLVLACESATGPVVNLLPSEPSLVSSDVVKTVLMRDGTLYSWGDGRSGTLGQGDEESLGYPTKVPGLERVIHYAQGGGMAFALTEDGSLYQWGQYMFSSVYPHPTTEPTKAGRVPGAVSVFAVVWRLYIVDVDGALWSVDPSHINPTKTPVPQRVPRPKRVAQVSGAVGLYQDGTLFSLQDWEPERGGPVQGLNGVIALHHSYESTMVLKGDGTVWAWGHEPECTLGDGVHTESGIPIQVPGLAGVTKISGSGGFRFAVKEDGTVWHWGYRGWDEDHTPICQTVPTQIPGISDAVAVSAHWEALIQTADGALYVFEPKTRTVTNVHFPDGVGGQ